MDLQPRPDGFRRHDEPVERSCARTLAERFRIDRPRIDMHQVSTDGTQKWLVGFADGHEAETVHIPESDRGTLCVSSQIGCTLTCSFCHTGTQKLVRNLTAEEIVGQVMLARERVRRMAVARPRTASSRTS